MGIQAMGIQEFSIQALGIQALGIQVGNCYEWLYIDCYESDCYSQVGGNSGVG